MSYYSEPEDPWNDSQSGNNSAVERRCNKCYGSGTDRDGADCIACEGWGSII